MLTGITPMRALAQGNLKLGQFPRLLPLVADGGGNLFCAFGGFRQAADRRCAYPSANSFRG
jgi:hypothetical protein